MKVFLSPEAVGPHDQALLALYAGKPLEVVEEDGTEVIIKVPSHAKPLRLPRVLLCGFGRQTFVTAPACDPTV